jgi:hypothetical protein
MAPDCVELRHNLDPSAFVWLWAKYVRGVNPAQHCTASLRGWYSTRLSAASNPDLVRQTALRLDERPPEAWRAIYVCGVAREGYHRKPRTNHPHNLHAVILPRTGATDRLVFERWELELTGGVFDPIPVEADLPAAYRTLPSEFTTCRIFRWAVSNQGRFTGPDEGRSRPPG